MEDSKRPTSRLVDCPQWGGYIERYSLTCIHCGTRYDLNYATGDVLIDFFSGNGTDDRGRTLVHIVKQSDDWLESNHDFIQWLFPLVDKSGANPNAPLANTELAFLFIFNDVARNNMLLGLDRMLSFYGMERKNQSMIKGSNWDTRKENWFCRPTHNDLRITRMLKSMTILGFGEYAQAFLRTLLQLSTEPDCGFSPNAIDYWRSAMSAKWRKVNFET